ncbi:cell wall anchor protein [Micromonospora sp. NPDC047707]|uniref:cell wall anchor protein n=1 Tax=Micromonospora sp. NPDC047707 TaxID=3154498 RepID=UPI003455B975
MIFRNRPLARLGAAALLAAGGLAVAATPAHAEDTKADLAVTVAGTTLAEGATEKIGWLKVKNNGPGTPTALTVGVDYSGWNDQPVDVLPLGEDCKGDGIFSILCTVPAERIPGPGEELEFPIVTFKYEPDGSTSGFSARFFLQSSDDTTPDNNDKRVLIEYEGVPGVDLGVVVPDVKTRADGKAIHPGDEALVFGEIVNQGDTFAGGVEIKLQLPKDVTFTEQYEGCEYSADVRTATCRDDTLVVDNETILLIQFPVKVADGVQAPATLPAGSLTADALGMVKPDSPEARAARKTSLENARLVNKGERITDVDPTDNVDGFAVVVAAKGGAGGGGEGDGDGDGPGLPVTGPQAGLMGGIGVAVLLAGGVMFLVARRRRIVLVSPGDEKPTA